MQKKIHLHCSNLVQKHLNLMTKIFISLIVGCLLYQGTFAQISTVKTVVAEGQVSLQVPTVFQQILNPENNQFLNSSTYIPNWGIINKTDQQQLLYSFTQYATDDNDIPLAFDELNKQLKSSYKRLKIIDDGIHLTDGRNIGYIVFSGNRNRNKKTGYLFYLSVKNRLLVFAFISNKKLDNEWKNTLDEMAKSITVAK